MKPALRLDKKTFNLIAGGVGGVAVLVLLFGVLDVSLPSFSFGRGTEQSGPQAPLYPIHDEASFVALTLPYKVEPALARNLAFEIRLPAEWTVQNTESDVAPDFSKRIISEISRLQGPYINIYRPEVVVQTVLLQHDMPADAWLKHYILSNSYILQGDVRAISARRAQAAFTYINAGEVMWVEVAAQFSGPEAVIARYEIPLVLKDHLEFVQKRAVESFTLTAGDDKPVEEHKPFTLAELIKFSYPASWMTAPPDLRDIRRINIQLFTQSAARIYQGYMHVFVVKRSAETDFTQEGERLRDFTARVMTLSVEDMISSEDYSDNPRFAFGRREIYNVASTTNTEAATQELTLMALGNEDIYVFILSLSPTATKDLYNWARNKYALDLVSKSIE